MKKDRTSDQEYENTKRAKTYQPNLKSCYANDWSHTTGERTQS